MEMYLNFGMDCEVDEKGGTAGHLPHNEPEVNEGTKEEEVLSLEKRLDTKNMSGVRTIKCTQSLFPLKISDMHLISTFINIVVHLLHLACQPSQMLLTHRN